jgi:TruD family tRNA pseudouridine synthase
MIVTDETEVSLGISTYMSPHVPGFSAISKARFSDFLVHEVGLDGRVARLTCLEPKVVAEASSSSSAAAAAAVALEDKETSSMKDAEENGDHASVKTNEATSTASNSDKDKEGKRKRTSEEQDGPEDERGIKKPALDGDAVAGTTTTTTTTSTSAAKTPAESKHVDETKSPDWATIQQELEALLLTTSSLCSNGKNDADDEKAAAAAEAALLSQRVVTFLQTTTDAIATATTADLKQMMMVKNKNTDADADQDQIIKFVSIVVSSSTTTKGNRSSSGSNNKDKTKISNANDPNKTAAASDEKEFRRKLHHWIRSRLDFCARADTADVVDTSYNDDTDGVTKEKKVHKVIRIWHKAFERQMPTWKTFEKYNHHCDNKNSNNSSYANRKRDNVDKLPYLRFVLYKENMDTGAALFQLQRRFADALGNGGRGGRGGGRGGCGGRNGGRSNNKFQQSSLRIGHAGMKDKRGVTSQFITVPTCQTNMYALTRMCNTSYNNSNSRNHNSNYFGAAGQALLRVGDFEFVPEELRLGRLQGNHFDIVLRNVQVPPPSNTASSSSSSSSCSYQEMLQKAVNALKRHGFINYFGLQRFGKHHDTHLTGIAIVKGDYATAIDIILRPKPGMEENESVSRARIQWQERFHKLDAETASTTAASGSDGKDGNNDDMARQHATAEQECAKNIVNCFNRSFQSSEVTVLHSLIQYPCDYERAFMSLNKTMRMMFLHALQSFLWNHVASLRIQQGYNQLNNNVGITTCRTGNAAANDEQCCHEVLVGDLVLLDCSVEATTIETTATAETSFEPPPPAPFSSSSSHNRKDSSFRIPAVHVVTAEDVTAKRKSPF